MYLIPQPQKLDFHPKQSYTISYDQKIVIHPSCGSDGDIPARLLQKELQDMLGCRLAGMGGLSEAVAVLLAAMPAGGTTAIVAAKYGGDAEFAAGCVTVSTVLSLIAIPLWCLAF